MKAKPVRIEQGVGYVQCAPEDATHVTLNIPGPSGRLTLPVIQRGKREGTGCWTWNGSTDAPTLRPSVLTNGTHRMTDEEYATVRSGGKIEPRPYRCHSWINDGAAQFLSDCSHELANTTVPLLDVPAEWDAPSAACPECGGKGWVTEAGTTTYTFPKPCNTCGVDSSAKEGAAL